MKKLGKNNEYERVHYFRCHHCTTHQNSMNHREVLQKNPTKRLKNADCPFSLSIRLKRDLQSVYSARINIDYNHSHPVQSLQTLSFKDISEKVSKEIRHLYEKGYTPGMAYRDCLQTLKSIATDDLDFHLKLADRSIIPRRRDFNHLYTEFHRQMFGTKNITEMFKNLEGTPFLDKPKCYRRYELRRFENIQRSYIYGEGKK